MNVFKFLKKTVLNACFYFTSAIFLILIVCATFMGDELYMSVAVPRILSSAALVFSACLIISALNFIWQLQYSKIAQWLLHFSGSLIAYSFVFILIPGFYNDISQVLVRTGVFTALYLIAAFTVLIVSSIRKTRRTEKLEYESQFGEFYNDK